MRVVALQDQNLNLGHAVLVVYVGDEPMLLDNQIASVVPANSIRHYNPVFSINEFRLVAAPPLSADFCRTDTKAWISPARILAVRLP